MSRGCLLDARTLAAELGVPLSWVYTKVETGHLPHLKLGRYVRFDRHDVDDWLTSRRRGQLTVARRAGRHEPVVP